MISGVIHCFIATVHTVINVSRNAAMRDWIKLEEEEVTSLPSTREQSSLYDGLIWFSVVLQ